MRSSFDISSSCREDIGMPVHLAMTSSMSLRVTLSGTFVLSFQRSLMIWRFSCSRSSSRRYRAAFSNSWAEIAFSMRPSITRIRRWMLIISSGTAVARSFTRAPASSIRSMALSGRKRSEMYRLDRYTDDSRASSVYFSWWKDSYFSLMPCRIRTLSSSVGGTTLMA